MCCCRCCNCVTCCFPIKGCAFTFTFISFLLQLAMCTFFLVFEVWYVFTAVAIVILFHIYFIFVSRGRHFCLLHVFTTYQSLWSLIYLGLFVWSIVFEIWPDTAGPFWDFYFDAEYGQYYQYTYAENDVQNLGWILMGVSFGSAIVQSYTLRVLFAYKKWLELQAVKNHLHRHHSSHHNAPQVTVITNTPVYTISPPPPSAPYHPPPPPPPSAYQDHGPIPGNAYIPPPQSAYAVPSAPPVSPVLTPDPNRRVYPEVPSTSAAHGDAPPTYDSAVRETGTAYENLGYEKKY